MRKIKRDFERYDKRYAFAITTKQRQWLEVFAKTNKVTISQVVRNFIEEMIRQYHDQWDADYHQAKPRRDEVLLLHDSGKNIREICRITGLFPESVRRLIEGFQEQIESGSLN